MEKVSLTGALKIPGMIVIMMQGMVIALLAVFMFDSSYLDAWSTYGNGSQTITVDIKNISEERQQDVEEYIYQIADSENLYIVRRENQLDQDGSFIGYTFGVYGNPDKTPAEMSFKGHKIITSGMLEKLINAKEDKTTLGIDKGSIYQLYNIPEVRYGNRFVIKKLQQMIRESGSPEGEYRIAGVTDDNVSEIMDGLSDVTGQNDLQKTMRGSESDSGVKKDILFVFVIAQIIVNIVYFIIVSIANLDKKGKLSLMGWSNISFCRNLFGDFVGYALISIPVATLAGLVISGWNVINMQVVSHYIIYGVLNAIITFIELMFAIIIQIQVKPLDAIRRRFPNKTLYAFGILGYLGISIAVVFCGIAIDSAAESIAYNSEIAKKWESVSEYEILNTIAVGNDENSFSGNVNTLNQDIYNWYNNIHDKDGVYLLHTAYYDRKILNQWNNNKIYQNIPESPFWYFCCSRSYIADCGIQMSDETIRDAENGVRIYLVSSKLEDSQKEKLKAWLEETAVMGINESDIPTKFSTDRKVRIVEYDEEIDFFTWPVDKDEEMTTNVPVIYYCTPANMKYFETESLKASGMDGYIKFSNGEIASECMNEDFMKEYHLSDNDIKFASVKKYIDGLQKDLMQTVIWFGLVFLMLGIILTGILLALASIYRLANKEKLNVQKFLGYGFWNMYKKPLILLSVVNLVQLEVLLTAKSKFGVAAMFIIICLQWLIFKFYMSKNEIKSLLSSFKES